MIESLLHDVDTLLLLLCASGALASAAAMLVLRQPMRVAMALITTMVLLGAMRCEREQMVELGLADDIARAIARLAKIEQLLEPDQTT